MYRELIDGNNHHYTLLNNNRLNPGMTCVLECMNDETFTGPVGLYINAGERGDHIPLYGVDFLTTNSTLTNQRRSDSGWADWHRRNDIKINRAKPIYKEEDWTERISKLRNEVTNLNEKAGIFSYDPDIGTELDDWKELVPNTIIRTEELTNLHNFQRKKRNRPNDLIIPTDFINRGPEECPVELGQLPLHQPVIPENWETLYDNQIKGESVPEVENAMDKAITAFYVLTSRKNRTREKAEEGVILVEKFKLSNFQHYIHGLVHFPDLLKRFLRVQKEKDAIIRDENLACMFSRCIEHRFEETFAQESIKHLLEFKGDKKLEIKLLPKKYSIDTTLYYYIHDNGVMDSYYDATEKCEQLEYQHKDVIMKEKEDGYTGFRDAYHCLLYGGPKHLQALIIRWDMWGDDCTADAARELYGLESGCPIEVVKAHVNKASSGLQ